ncbi:MAG: glycoside hydrolase family 127 protein [Sedimentisphaerales bacterium]|nr:glycoside hydrolase family 127 protein [Sedimentisphaerales bacterium]
MGKANSIRTITAILGLLLWPVITVAQSNPEAVNLAIVATPSSSYVSSDTKLEALNDGYDPRSSRDSRRGSYGNWPQTGTQWVEYTWSKPICTNKIDVYWWDDGRGVRLPRACRLLYWDGNKFVQVKDPVGLGVEGNRYNTTTFETVRTTRLRLEIDSDGQNSTGILEWKVYDAGGSPTFPPIVDAGIDRVVVVGGKTYLSGTYKVLKTDPNGPGVKLAWSKRSGPGQVVFEDPTSTTTTARFNRPGQYVLQLAARLGDRVGSDTLTVKAIKAPQMRPLEPLDLQPYKVDSPLWSDRVKALIVNWIPHCIEKISDPNLPEGGINNFIEAANKLAGRPAGRHRGYVFSNAWVYNTIEAICLACLVDPQGDQQIISAQQAMRQTLEDWIPKILAAQEPDGYIQTAFTLSNRERWSPRFRGDHEGYVAGYFIEAAIAHYIMTEGKDRRLYDAAKRLADCWYANIGPAPKKEWYDGHQEMEQALVRFGRFVNQVEGNGQGRRYIELAKFLLDCRRDGSEYDQSHLPVIQQYEAVGHAVRAAYTYSAMADIALEMGDIDYLSATMSLWDNIINRKYYVTGGIGSGETSEGFGPNYSLRNNAYCESCSSCGFVFFQHKLNRLWADARFADLYEDTLYNALLGSIDLEGRNFYYQNPLEERRPRYPWHGCPCCVGNIPRVLLMLPTWMYQRSIDGIYVNLFIGSTTTIKGIAGTDVQIVQKTEYPWDGDVSITINPAQDKRFKVMIRSPKRYVSELYEGRPEADGITAISVNGRRITPKIEDGYVILDRQWKAGDRIELKLPMKVQRVKADKRIAADLGRVALRYGPLIYCVERIDQDIDQVLPPNEVLTSQWRPDLLGGVVVINGRWADGKPLMAIPYYARLNRGTGPQGDRRPVAIVWIKDR